MKANAPASRAALALTPILTMVLAACGPQPRPVALPPPPPAPVAKPAPAPAPVVAPPPVHADWRDAPATPGDWRWAMAGPISRAAYGGDGGTLFALECDPASRAVALRRSGAGGQGAGPMTVTTTDLHRAIAATRAAGTPGDAVATLPASDPLLDAMAFSRGRFMVESPGFPALYLPSWPEVSRVIEDCR